MMRLSRGGNTVQEIATETGILGPIVGRLLREMLSLNPQPVQATVDEGRGKQVWFTTSAADEYLDR
jgi:F420-0:gamma-glutamyl ligase-like protein